MTVAPNIGALTAASNTAGSAASAATEAANKVRNRPVAQDLPSIITVEVLGYGGSTPGELQRQEGQRRKTRDQQSYDPSSSVRYVGVGPLTEEEKLKLTPEERHRLSVQ